MGRGQLSLKILHQERVRGSRSCCICLQLDDLLSGLCDLLLMRCRHGVHGCLLSEPLTGHRDLSCGCGLLGSYFQLLAVLGCFQSCAVFERRNLCLEIPNSRHVRRFELCLLQSMLPHLFTRHLAVVYLHCAGCCRLRGGCVGDGRSALFLWLVRGRARFRWLQPYRWRLRFHLVD